MTMSATEHIYRCVNIHSHAHVQSLVTWKIVASGYNSGLFDYNNSVGSKMPLRLYVSMIGFNKKNPASLCG